MGENPVYSVGVSEDDFSKYFHNDLSPCIAEETDTSEDYIYVFTLLMPVRTSEYCQKEGDNSHYTPATDAPEGLLSFKIKKSDLQIEKWNLTRHRDWGDDNRCLWFNEQNSRTWVGNTSPKFGNCMACIFKNQVKFLISAGNNTNFVGLALDTNLNFAGWHSYDKDNVS